MLSLLRRRTARTAGVLLATLALALVLLMPAGFMPGTSLAAPIVLCDGQAPMPAMAMPDHHGHGTPDRMPHPMGDHGCPFAASGTTPLTPQLASAALPSVTHYAAAPATRPLAAAPGRGLAAPPPPAHAPPHHSA